MLAMQKVKIQDMIDTLTDKLKTKDYLRWKDKYGKAAKVQETEAWKVEDATSAQVKRINLITCAEKVVAQMEKDKRQYVKDSALMKLESNRVGFPSWDCLLSPTMSLT